MVAGTLGIIALFKFIFEPFDGSKVTVVAIQCVFIICLVSGIVGAVNYNKINVLLALIAHVSDLVLACVYFNSFPMWMSVGSVVVDCLFLYPHVVLLKEMQYGIMTPANYENEKQSCCCV